MSLASGPLGRIRFFGLQWFATVMGWSGLGLALLRAEPLIGATARGAAYAAAVIALVTFGLVLLASISRVALGHSDALREDIAHPVRQAFVSAVPVALLLVATLFGGLGLFTSIAESAWLIGALVQFLVTAWLIGAWFRRGLNWASVTPLIFIPVAGNVLVPLGGALFEHRDLAVFFLGIGSIAWPVVLALLLARTAHQALPRQLEPTWFITIAPPAVIGLDLLALGTPTSLAVAAFGLATLFAACAATLVPGLIRAPFGMPFWGMSFPLAAFAGLALTLAQTGSVPVAAALCVLACAAIVVVALTLRTLQGLLNGSLLIPDQAPNSIRHPAS